MQAGQLVVLQGRRRENESYSVIPLDPHRGELHLGHHQRLYLHLAPDSAYLDISQLTPAQRSCLKLQYIHVQSDALGIAGSGLYPPKSQNSDSAKVHFAQLTSKLGHRSVLPPKEVQYTVFINVLDITRPAFSSLTYSDHNAVLIFPNEPPSGRSIWINYKEMGKVSSYFTRLFEAGFLESEIILPSTKGCPAAIHQDVDNIVQICRNRSQQSAIAEDSGIGLDPMESDIDLYFDDDDIDFGEAQGVRYAIIEDTPYAVYRAVVTWVLTGKIRFSPLPSRKNDTSQPAALPFREGDFHSLLLRKTVPCSPKAVYELAHKLEIPALCQLALQDYEMQLDDSNVITELFSYFAEIFPEVQARGIKVLERYSRKVVAAGGLDQVLKLANEGRTDSIYALQLVCQISKSLVGKSTYTAHFSQASQLR